MFRPTQPFLIRLRRHRGLWLLAVLIVMFKLVTGTVCLGDVAGQRLATVSTTSSLALDMSAAETPAAIPDCLLGEPGGCHCSCAHSLTVPSAALLSMTAMVVSFSSPLIRSGYVPAMTGSLLRPPIA
ncbi:MAG: hypothetical protein ABI268_02275 [Rhodanobacter sp.]